MKKTIVTRLESMVAEWKAQFENPPEINFNFSVSKDDKLLLNGMELCAIADIEMDEAAHDVETLVIGPVMLALDWPYDGKPRLFMEREIPVGEKR